MSNQNNLRLPAVPVEEFIFATQLMNGVIDGNVETVAPEEFALQLPDGSLAPLDNSFSARLYLALRQSLDHLDHVQIYSITQRFPLIDLTMEDTKFSDYFNEDKTHVTDQLIEAIARFPLWTSDTEKESVNRLHKFLTRFDS